MATGKGFNTTGLVLVVFIALALLYLFSQFVEITDGDVAFLKPDIGETTEMVYTIILLGAATLIAIALASKIGKPLARRDAFTIILIMVALYFLWDKVLAGLIDNLPGLGQMVYAGGQKLGLIP